MSATAALLVGVLLGIAFAVGVFVAVTPTLVQETTKRAVEEIGRQLREPGRAPFDRERVS